jgi:hypothetical protein
MKLQEILFENAVLILLTLAGSNIYTIALGERMAWIVRVHYKE